jgi:hypothetical protein
MSKVFRALRNLRKKPIEDANPNNSTEERRKERPSQETIETIDLYSTAGPTGMRIVAEPSDATLEYINFGRCLPDKLSLTRLKQYRICTRTDWQPRQNMDASKWLLLARSAG